MALAEISIERAASPMMVILPSIFCFLLSSTFLECKCDLCGYAIRTLGLASINAIVLNLERGVIVEIETDSGQRSVAPADVVIDRFIVGGIEILVPEVRPDLSKASGYL